MSAERRLRVEQKRLETTLLQPKAEADSGGGQCDECFVSFGEGAQLSSHRALFHGEAATVEYACSSCDERMQTLAALAGHRCADAPKRRLALAEYCVCLVCGCAEVRARLAQHIRDSHSADLQSVQALSPASEKRGNVHEYFCQFCSPRTRVDSCVDLLTHISSWHAAAVRIEAHVVELCRLCGAAVPQSQFRQHVVRFHCKSPVKPLVKSQPKARKSVASKREACAAPRCDRCNSQFEDEATAALHVLRQVCQPTSSLNCPFCNAARMNWMLWQHVTEECDLARYQLAKFDCADLPLLVCGLSADTSSSEPLSYPCDRCGVVFGSGALQRTHMAVFVHRSVVQTPSTDLGSSEAASLPSVQAVAEKRPFVCRLCGARFAAQHTLRTHAKVLHDETCERSRLLQAQLLLSHGEGRWTPPDVDLLHDAMTDADRWIQSRRIQLARRTDFSSRRFYGSASLSDHDYTLDSL